MKLLINKKLKDKNFMVLQLLESNAIEILWSLFGVVVILLQGDWVDQEQ